MTSDKRVRAIVLMIAVAVAMIATGAFLAPRMIRYFEIDGCLDSGGAWNYAAAKCSHERR